MKDVCGHLTDTTITRHSQMIGVGKVVRRVYEIQVSELSRPMVHSKTTTDRQKDVIELVRLLHGENLFTNKPGRKHVSFSDM